jgi:hypothetical protein
MMERVNSTMTFCKNCCKCTIYHQYNNNNKIKEERIILAHGFRDLSPLLFGLIHLGKTSWQWVCGQTVLYFLMERNQKVEHEGARNHVLPLTNSQ